MPFALENARRTRHPIHSDLYAEYEADRALTPEQRAAGLAHYSDDYLADRAAMLTWEAQARHEGHSHQPDSALRGCDGSILQGLRQREEIVLGIPPNGQTERRLFLSSVPTRRPAKR